MSFIGMAMSEIQRLQDADTDFSNYLELSKPKNKSGSSKVYCEVFKEIYFKDTIFHVSCEKKENKES